MPPLRADEDHGSPGLFSRVLLRPAFRSAPRSPFRGRGHWLVLALSAAAGAAVLFLVDLTPRVSSDFFFASDDPQLRDAEAIEALFPSRPQIVVSAAAPDVRANAYLDHLRTLDRELSELRGVAVVRSLVAGPTSPEDGFQGPFWSRLLGTASRTGETYLIVELAPAADPSVLVPRLQSLLARLEAPGFHLTATGVPYVVELIRRHLLRDLQVFTASALVLFGLLIAAIYRDARQAVGILATCLAACATTLATLRLVGLGIGVLTANIVTIVFVLTLSHLVYLTANWRRISVELGMGEEALGAALAYTGGASFWCMATTLLGFVSLLMTSAEPLRELGRAGSIGTLIAFGAAYGLYPSFLRGRDPGRSSRRSGEPFPAPRDPFGGRRLGRGVAAVAALALVATLGLPRIDTDPGLLSYFARGSAIRSGLEALDAAGSSPLRIVFRDPAGGRLDSEAAYLRLEEVQQALDRDPAVGTGLSLAALVDQAAEVPMARLLGVPGIVGLLSTPAFQGIASSFITADRTRSVLVLRMREAGRRQDRDAVVRRLEEVLRNHGFEPTLSGGLYELQGKLSDLVASSLLVGLGGLGILFAGIAWAVSRSLVTSAAMLACLAGTPLFIFGSMGLAGLPVDFVSSPAANVAVGMGIDSMIHLVTAVRQLRSAGLPPWSAWVEARARLWRPVVGAVGILALGFGLFALSSFPPTRRFGIAVVVGLVSAAVLTLVVLPYLGSRDGGRGTA